MAVHVRWPLLPYAAHRRALASVCSRHLEHYLLVRCCCLVYACYLFFLRRGPACRCAFLAVFPSFSSCVMDSCPFFSRLLALCLMVPLSTRVGCPSVLRLFQPERLRARHDVLVSLFATCPGCFLQ